MKAVFASALVAAATALPWEDSQRWAMEPSFRAMGPVALSEPSYRIPHPRPQLEFHDGMYQPKDSVQQGGNLKIFTSARDNYSASSPGEQVKRAYDFCTYFSPERVNGEEGSSPLETNMQMAGVKISTDWAFDHAPYANVDGRFQYVDVAGMKRIPDADFLSGLKQGPIKGFNVSERSVMSDNGAGDDVMTATRSMFCKSCFGGDDVQTTARFCKSCFGGDVEVQARFCKSCFGGDDVETTARFCKSCFGGDDAEVKARFCKSCFGGDDVETTARFCKSCFGGDDAEVKARFCKSCFGGDAETQARFCKSCFGGDAETQARFCKSCFGGDDVETTARFCKSCFGGDDAEVNARFCKSCFGGDDAEVKAAFCKSCFGGDDVETTTRFCKSCFGGDDAEVKARFCKSCFGGDDVLTTVAFCKSCFGGDDAEVKARFCKSCFGGDVESHARFCKSCFGGDDAEVESRFCKSCFGGDVLAQVKCDCNNSDKSSANHYGLGASKYYNEFGYKTNDSLWDKLKYFLKQNYSVLSVSHMLGVDVDACECAVANDQSGEIAAAGIQVSKYLPTKATPSLSYRVTSVAKVDSYSSRFRY